jgi:hypothetical protein
VTRVGGDSPEAEGGTQSVGIVGTAAAAADHTHPGRAGSSSSWLLLFESSEVKWRRTTSEGRPTLAPLSLSDKL